RTQEGLHCRQPGFGHLRLPILVLHCSGQHGWAVYLRCPDVGRYVLCGQRHLAVFLRRTIPHPSSRHRPCPGHPAGLCPVGRSRTGGCHTAGWRSTNQLVPTSPVCHRHLCGRCTGGHHGQRNLHGHPGRHRRTPHHRPRTFGVSGESMSTPSYLMGLIGEGVRPSLTPPMHEREATAHGLRFVYRPIDLSELELPATAVGELLTAGTKLGFNAFNVTHPCKQVVLEHLDAIDPAAQRLGACNTVLIDNGKLIGYNTDRSGFASALALELPDADLTDVV